MLTKKKLISDFFRSNQLLLISTFLAGILSGFATLIIPLFIGKFYEVVLERHSLTGKYFDFVVSDSEDAGYFFILFFFLVCFRSVFIFFQKYLTGYLSELFSKKLREDLLARQLSFQMTVHERKPVGKYLLRYSGDLNAIQRYISGGIITFATDLIFVFLAFSLLFYIQKELAIILLILFPPVFLFINYLNKKLKLFTLKRRNIRSENLSFVSSRLSALLTVKIFNREKIEHGKFERNSRKLFDYGVLYYRWYAFIHALFPLFLYVMLGAVMYYLYYLKVMMHIQISTSKLVIFLMLTIKVLPVFKNILRVNMIWQAGAVSIQKILGIMNSPAENRGERELVMDESGSLVFENVSFGFKKERPVIVNTSFCIRPNEITLIKGKQGTGKSTLIKLILGIYACDSGIIKINETDISAIGTFSIRKKVTLVSEELPLLGKTVFESVSYSRKEHKRLPAENMLKKFNYGNKDDVFDLDQKVEEQGRNLSRGQRKILLITRALLTRKKIILMDEPFSGLDEDSSQNLIKQLNFLRQNRTIVILDDKEAAGLHYDQVIELNTF